MLAEVKKPAQAELDGALSRVKSGRDRLGRPQNSRFLVTLLLGMTRSWEGRCITSEESSILWRSISFPKIFGTSSRQGLWFIGEKNRDLS